MNENFEIFSRIISTLSSLPKSVWFLNTLCTCYWCLSFLLRSIYWYLHHLFITEISGFPKWMQGYHLKKNIYKRIRWLYLFIHKPHIQHRRIRPRHSIRHQTCVRLVFHKTYGNLAPPLSTLNLCLSLDFSICFRLSFCSLDFHFLFRFPGCLWYCCIGWIDICSL